MKKTKENRGITLIALVITIIVLLILASVSIAMLTGNNGIIIQAKLAKENTIKAQEKEENDLKEINQYMNEKTENAVPGKIVSQTIKNNYIDSNGDKATIPAGFTVSKISEEQNIAGGLVIYDIPETEITNVDWTTKNEDGAYNVQTLYNQFVWIPVTNEEEYKRDLTYPSIYCINNQWTYSEKTPENTTYTDTEYLPINIQPEEDEPANNEIAEKEAIMKYNGFYIARYEAGIENNLIVSKQNQKVYAKKSQVEFKVLGKTMYENDYVKSAMSSGIQWDTVMKFIDKKRDESTNENNIFNVRIFNQARHNGKDGGVLNTGKNLSDKVQNIYDLEGNCVEFVAEKINVTLNFSARGGFWESTNDCASLRASYRGDGYDSTTFRPVLYIM